MIDFFGPGEAMGLLPGLRERAHPITRLPGLDRALVGSIAGKPTTVVSRLASL
jgi:hypothetical protein